MMIRDSGSHFLGHRAYNMPAPRFVEDSSFRMMQFHARQCLRLGTLLGSIYARPCW